MIHLIQCGSGVIIVRHWGNKIIVYNYQKNKNDCKKTYIFLFFIILIEIILYSNEKVPKTIVIIFFFSLSSLFFLCYSFFFCHLCNSKNLNEYLLDLTRIMMLLKRLTSLTFLFTIPFKFKKRRRYLNIPALMECNKNQNAKHDISAKENIGMH